MAETEVRKPDKVRDCLVCVHDCEDDVCFLHALAVARTQGRFYNVLAAEISGVASSKGFERVQPDNFLVKLMFVVTEINEVIEHDGDENLGEELADVAMRLLAAVHDMTGGQWASRIDTRRPKANEPPQHAPIAVHVAPILSKVCEAAERFRVGAVKDAIICAELAILETYRAADRLRFPLDHLVLKKLAKNRKREYLHGKGFALA